MTRSWLSGSEARILNIFVRDLNSVAQCFLFLSLFFFFEHCKQRKIKCIQKKLNDYIYFFLTGCCPFSAFFFFFFNLLCTQYRVVDSGLTG